MDSTWIYISEQVRNTSNDVINPSTIESQNSIIDAIENITDTPLVKWDDWEIFTRDIWLDKVFGNNPLTNNWQLKSVVTNASQVTNNKITWLNSERWVPTNDYSTCSIQISWTWVGTISYECSSNWWNFVSLAGINITTNSLVTSVTANSIVKFNVSWLQLIRVRMSAFTSWVALVNFTLSSWEQQQPLSQRATTFELNTYDTNLATLPTAIGTTQMYQTWFELEGIRQSIPTVNPTQPTTYADPKFANYPQKFRRLRVESGGSERLPFAQEPHTNIQLVKDKDQISILEQILINLIEMNLSLKIMNGVDTSQ